MNTFPQALRTPAFDIAILGYALFLVINACSLWGGVFPFFPSEFHNSEVTFAFMMAQSLASLLTYIVVLVCSFQVPSVVTRSLHGVSSFPAFLGGLLLIAALYLPAWRIALVTVAGCCMGAGGTLLSLVWARYFSAETTDRGNFFILTGTLCAPVLFALLYMVPQAVRVFLIPLIFVPLCGLSVLLSFRKLDKNLPIFQDAPRENVPVYVRIVRIYWKSAFAVGTMGFASGLVRSIAVANVQLGDATNAASFWGLFVAAGVMLLLWQRRSFSVNVHTMFMMSFPLVAGCLAVFPFVQGNALALISGIVFLLFSLANTIVMLQSAHICLNRGCNPFFVYGFFGAIVGFLQNSGFIFGHTAMTSSLFGVGTPFAVAIIGLLVLTITLYAFVGRSERFTSNLPQYDNVEFVSFGAAANRPRRTWLQLIAPAAQNDAGELLDVEVISADDAPAAAHGKASAVAAYDGTGAAASSVSSGESPRAGVGNAEKASRVYGENAFTGNAGAYAEAAGASSGAVSETARAEASGQASETHAGYAGAPARFERNIASISASVPNASSSKSLGSSSNTPTQATHEEDAARAASITAGATIVDASTSAERRPARGTGAPAQQSTQPAASNRAAADTGNAASDWAAAGAPLRNVPAPPALGVPSMGSTPDAPGVSGASAPAALPQSAPAPETRKEAAEQPADFIALLGDLYRSPEKAPSRITLRCKILQEQYRLTSRETEIMELIVRGYSVARIAEEHVVSENTVRTHYKHIYAKLGVHKKAELIAMVDALKDVV